MAKLKFKNSKGEWESIAAFQGEPGKDGAIQYTAGDGIKIENNIISTTSEGGSGLIGVYTIHLPNMRSNGNYAAGNTTEQAVDIRNKFAEILMQAKKDGFEKPSFIVIGYDGTPRMYECKTYYEYTDNTQYAYTSVINSNNENNIGVTTGLRNFKIGIVTLWENDTCTCTSVTCSEGSRHVASTSDVLTKTNTTSYTPSSNYHPATKKYVDDSIKTAITDALGGSY